MDWNLFFVVHKDLPREGPGTADDVAWAMQLGDLAPDAVICDAAAGPGGDTAALLSAVPKGRVVGFDKRAEFVGEMQARFANEDRLTVRQGLLEDTAAMPDAPFDAIWCAGALYFLGLTDGLAEMHRALKPGGLLAFSEPCFFTETPSGKAQAFWEGYATPQPGDITRAMADCGFAVLGQRKVPDAGWEEYFQPMEARIADLRPGADAAMTEMLDMHADEARQWRAVKHETGYMLSVGRKL